MSTILQHIRASKASKKKHKELVAELSTKIIKDKKLFAELVDSLKTGTDVEKGTCAEIMKFVTAEKPEYALDYIDVLLEYVNYKAPRVKWGVPESLGNIAKKYPDNVEDAIPLLLKNTKEDSTVVRWCAAYALSEMAKSSEKLGKKLKSEFERIIRRENNNGVRKVYEGVGLE